MPAALKAAVAKNTSQMRKYPLEPDKGFLIRLSREELECFGEEAAEVACQSGILVGSKDYYYKIPIRFSASFITYTMSQLKSAADPITFGCIRSKTGKRVGFFKSPTLPHDPMDHDEAKQCLYNLVKEVAHTIQDLHALDWAHQDIRLDNICYNADYQPVLIDLDRVHNVMEYPPVIYPDSCMYTVGFDTQQMDWLQLGWLAAWAYCGPSGTEYHDRRLEDLPQQCQNDTFLMDLMKEGMCMSSVACLAQLFFLSAAVM